LLSARHIGPRGARWTRVSELETANAKPLFDVVRQRHELFVDVFIVAVHQANLERLRVECSERQYEVGNAGGVELAWPNFVAGATADVPRRC
jgi:hypothetical protein